ncbi:MFS transporter [Kitasatospora sp. NPDC091335]|uniref:MFS transporter n=1 Tax=Kitasatospora sp. NPDC091335 TaxID=3364085 RepID=UPI003819CFC9
MTRAQVSGFTDPLSWGSLVVAIAALVVFGVRTVRVDQPFVPPALFTHRVYRTDILVAFLAMVVNLGGLVFVPLLLVEVNELTPGQGALVMIPAGVVTALLSPWIGRLAGRVDTRVLVLSGLGLIGLFSLFLSAFTGGSSVVFAGVGILGLSIGFMLVMTSIIGAAASELPPEQVGAGLGILQGAQFLGAGTGPAVFGVLVSARQQGASDAVNPLYCAEYARPAPVPATDPGSVDGGRRHRSAERGGEATERRVRRSGCALRGLVAGRLPGGADGCPDGRRPAGELLGLPDDAVGVVGGGLEHGQLHLLLPDRDTGLDRRRVGRGGPLLRLLVRRREDFLDQRAVVLDG